MDNKSQQYSNIPLTIKTKDESFQFYPLAGNVVCLQDCLLWDCPPKQLQTDLIHNDHHFIYDSAGKSLIIHFSNLLSHGLENQKLICITEDDGVTGKDMLYFLKEQHDNSKPLKVVGNFRLEFDLAALDPPA